MKKRIKKLKKNLKLMAKLEAKDVLKFGFDFAYLQVKIRPRAVLFSKFVLILSLLLVALSPASGYFGQKREITIAGHKIIVAQALEVEHVEESGIDQEISAQKSPFQFFKPVDGYISQGFSSYHMANDIVAPFGTFVHPIGEGTVGFAGMIYDGHGNMIVVDHGNGLKSSYSHLGKIYVGVGNKVDGQTNIGTVGLTGRTTGAHVHMEIIDNDIFVDPSGILPK